MKFDVVTLGLALTAALVLNLMAELTPVLPGSETLAILIKTVLRSGAMICVVIGLDQARRKGE